jgi:hypothetical protein
LAIFEPFLFFHVLHIKKIQITVEAAVIFQHSPRITKQIDKSNTMKAENGFRIKQLLFGDFLSISVYNVTHIKRNLDPLDRVFSKSKVFGITAG